LDRQSGRPLSLRTRDAVGSTPAPGADCPGGERDIMAPSEGAGPGSTPGRGTVLSLECGGGTPPCEGGGYAGSTPARDTVAEPKAAAGPGCEPGLCGFDSHRPPYLRKSSGHDDVRRRFLKAILGER